MREECIYLAGPMSGFFDYNYQRFVDVAAEIKAFTGLHVVHTANVPRNQSWWEYITTSVGMLQMCDYMIVMPGSEHSLGAQVEIRVAEQMGLPIYAYPKCMTEQFAQGDNP